MPKITIITSAYDPWQAWNLSLLAEFESGAISARSLCVEADIIDAHSQPTGDLYFVRSNSAKAIVLCSYLFNSGERIVNGASTTLYWPRIAALKQLNRYNIPTPRAFWGYNLSSIYNRIPATLFPIVKKSNSLADGQPERINSKAHLLDLAARWSVDPVINNEPFYFEEYIQETKLIKVYVIGNRLYAFERFEGFGQKVVQREPVPFALNAETEAVLLEALKSCGLQIISLDVLFKINDLSNWWVIDVNLVPMFTYLRNAPALLYETLTDSGFKTS